MSTDSNRDDVDELQSRIKNAYRNSWFSRLVHSFLSSEAVSHVFSGYHFWIETALRSVFYRKLCRATEPSVVVIDFRDTLTFGPVIFGINRISDRIEPIYRNSRSRELLSALAKAASRLIRSD